MGYPPQHQQPAMGYPSQQQQPAMAYPPQQQPAMGYPPQQQYPQPGEKINKLMFYTHHSKMLKDGRAKIHSIFCI